MRKASFFFLWGGGGLSLGERVSSEAGFGCFLDFDFPQGKTRHRLEGGVRFLGGLCSSKGLLLEMLYREHGQGC